MTAGCWVSRVGGAPKERAIKDKRAAGGLRLVWAASGEPEASAQRGTELDAATQSRLDRGYRMVEILKQGQYQPMNVIDQVLVIYAGTRGHLDKIPATDVQTWEKQFLSFIHDQKNEIWNTLNDKREM